jgi:hypothetical protein
MPSDLASVALLFLAASRSVAGAPDAPTIVGHMKEALEPARASTRKLTIVVSGEMGEPAQWIAGQAREQRGDGKRMLTVVLAPEAERGIAILFQDRGTKPDRQWVYVPAVRRVREISRPETYQAFLNTDFTFADLGFVSPRERYELLGRESRDGVQAYKVQAVPHEQWYYSRIVTWVAADSWLPLRREFHDPAGLVWKVETWGDVTRIDDVPIPLLDRMEDVRQKGSTEMRVSDVLWDREFPADFFEPRNLPSAADAPLWNAAPPG